MKYYIIKESSKNYSVKEKYKILNKIKDLMKKDSFIINLLKENGKSEDMIDEIPIDFDTSLEVSAQTINGAIKLNEKLLSKPMSIIMRYIVHELVHVFQHIDGLEDDGKKKNYLDNKDEVEAFKKQIEFDAINNGIDKAVDYTQKLIKFHKYPKKKRDQKLKELTEELKDDKGKTDKSRGKGN